MDSQCSCLRREEKRAGMLCSTMKSTTDINKHTTILHSTSFTLLPTQTSPNSNNAHYRTPTLTGKVFRVQRR